jgi:peptidoglycan/LPS O-acetylase OafA/YrhL
MTDWSPPRTLPGRVSRVPNLPGLDGLRAIAVVAVMIYHADSSWLHGGFLGVEVFFVISGYLITLLLIAEFEGSGRVSLRQFWLRRFRRLLPALFVMLGLLMIYLVVGFPSAQGRTRGDIVGGVAYVSNWYQIAVGAGYTAREAFAPLRHLWSLAVEEQFYLVWPLIMLLILTRAGLARLPRVALWLVGITIFITAVVGVLFVPGDIDSTCTPDSSYGYWHFGSRCISVNDALYLGTLSRAGGLMLGAAFAMVWRPLALLRGPMRKKGHWLDAIAVVGLAGLAVLARNVHLAEPAETILTGTRFDPWLFRGGFLLTGVATLLVIAAVTHRRAWMGKLLGNPLFRWVGTRSYGLYLYHWPIYQIIRKEAGIALRPSQFVLAVAITIPFTELSYRYVELPIRQGRIGEWLRGERRRPTPAVVKRRRRIAAFGLAFTIMLGFASVSIAIAPNKCVGQVECANAEGAAAIQAAASSVPSVPFVPRPSPSVPSAPSAAPSAAPTATPAGPSTPDATAPQATAPAPSGADPAAVPGETAAPAATTPAVPAAEAPTGDAAGPAIAPPVVPETTAEPTTAEPTTTLPVDQRPPYAIGESVMLGAAAQLQAGGFVVNADTSRQGKQMVDVIGQHRAAGELGHVVVIQSGTNGSVSQDTYDRMMALLPPEMTPIVVFLTVHADRGWIAGNNALIRALPSRYPNVRVLEWDGLVAGGAIPGMARDGIHLDTYAAKQTYANYIFDLIGRRDLVKPVG